MVFSEVSLFPMAESFPHPDGGSQGRGCHFVHSCCDFRLHNKYIFALRTFEALEIVKFNPVLSISSL